MKLSYRLAEKNDYQKILPLAEQELNSGQGYEEYMRAIFDELGKNAFGIVACREEEIIGFAFLEKGLALTGGREDFFPEIKKDIGGEEIWTGAAYAVTDEYLNCKVGSALYIYALSHLEDIGAKHLLLEIWVRPDGYAPSNANLATAGRYTEYGVVENFYAHAAGYICPVCGARCKCSAKIAVVHI
ncbi:MAG: GNAT family N-acetyltransferase [bacterium]|nr:GNAT family N-acetyltransferase [bacterium]